MKRATAGSMAEAFAILNADPDVIEVFFYDGLAMGCATRLPSGTLTAEDLDRVRSAPPPEQQPTD